MGLLRAASNRSAIAFTVFARPDLYACFPAIDNVQVLRVAERSAIARVLWSRRDATQLCRSHELDVIQFETAPLPHGCPCPTVFVLHDVRDGRVTWTRPLAFLRRLLVRSAARRATAVVTPSHASQAEISTIFGLAAESIAVIPAVMDSPADMPVPLAPAKRERFVLALGHIERRKNLDVLIRAAQHRDWPPGVALIIAGRDAGQKEALVRAANEKPCDVHFVDRVTEDDKWSMLNAAEAVLVPSLIEGFGIVVLEAIMAGSVALVSDRTSLPEVVGVPEAVIPATDASAWAKQVNRIVNDQAFRERIRGLESGQMRRFSQESVGIELEGLYTRVAAHHSTDP